VYPRLLAANSTLYRSLPKLQAINIIYRMSVYSCLCLISVSMGILYGLMTVKVGGQPTTSDEDANENNLIEMVRTLKDKLHKLEAMISITPPDKPTGQKSRQYMNLANVRFPTRSDQ